MGLHLRKYASFFPPDSVSAPNQRLYLHRATQKLTNAQPRGARCSPPTSRCGQAGGITSVLVRHTRMRQPCKMT